MGRHTLQLGRKVGILLLVVVHVLVSWGGISAAGGATGGSAAGGGGGLSGGAEGVLGEYGPEEVDGFQPGAIRQEGGDFLPAEYVRHRWVEWWWWWWWDGQGVCVRCRGAHCLRQSGSVAGCKLQCEPPRGLICPA